jgi:cytoskeleton protein RodZ
MPAERASGGLGRKLRDARERRGASLREIANRTKISVSVLEALERDDISRLPGGIFGRAFVKSFAEAVGLDPDAAIREFVGQFPNEPAIAALSSSVPIEDHEGLESDRRLAATFLVLCGVSVPIAGLLVYFSLAGRPAGTPPPDRPAAASTRTDVALAPDVAQETAPDAAPIPPSEGVPEALPGPASQSGLTVNLVLSRRSWVSAIVDDSNQIEGILSAGEMRTLDAQREIVLRVGDAGAVTLTINGRKAKPLGKAGAVATARLNPTTFKNFLADQ